MYILPTNLVYKPYAYFFPRLIRIINKKQTNFKYSYYSETMENISITEFFRDTTIFVTGGTGFLGLALLEKLLRSCKGIKTIYVLLRSKRGLNVDQRYEELINDQVFDRIRNKNSEVLKKLVLVSGDMNLPLFGLNENDTNTIINEVNIVFHNASVIKFNEKLSVALNLNTIATRTVLDLCLSIKKLKSFVYASTAYCNFPRTTIYEEVYPTTPLTKESFLTLVENLPEEMLNKIEDTLKGSHDNTYTLTKSLAESIISDYNSKIPVCIVRPSAITGAIAEPNPGWVSGAHGVTSLITRMGYERVCSIIGDENSCLDVIPIDTVVNTIIAAAWATSFRKSSSVQVYNCTSGQSNPIKLKEVLVLTNRYWNHSAPRPRFLPKLRFNTNTDMHMLLVNIFHFTPAYFYDFVSRVQGLNPTMVRTAQQHELSDKIVKPFFLKDWNFDTKNFKELIDLVKASKDGKEFNCDISMLDWELYFKNYLLGIENYILKGRKRNGKL